MLSQQTIRLKITTFLAESCGGYELIISAENDANHKYTNGLDASDGAQYAQADKLCDALRAADAGLAMLV